MPHLDHISLLADRRAFEELGFRVTASAGPTEHARIFLDRTYLELRPPAHRQVAVGSQGWFLRPADLSEAADALRAAGLHSEGPSPYRAEDGSWLDVSPPAADASALPVLTKRVDRPDGEWPPPLVGPHPNGATRIAELHLQAQDPAPLMSLFEALEVPSVGSGTHELAGRVRVMVSASDGGANGVVAVVLDRPGAPQLRLETEPTRK